MPLNGNTCVINVKDHGAIGDGVADDTNSVQAAADAAKLQAAGSGPNENRGAVLYFPCGQYKMTGELNFDETYAIRLEGHGVAGGPESPESATLLFKQAGAATVTLISARGSSNFQMFGLDVQYDNVAFLGTVVATDGTYDGAVGHDTSYVHIENCSFSGATVAASNAKYLLSLNMNIDATVKGCSFRFAENGICGRRDGGWGSFTVSIEDCVFTRIWSGGGIRNPGGTWLVKSCSFAYAAGFDNRRVGILCDDDGMSWLLNVDNCWFGDGGGYGETPAIQFNGFVLNVIGTFISSSGPNQANILISGAGGTVHNVNIQGCYLAPDNDAPAIRVAPDAVVESMSIIGNWNGYGTALVENLGIIISKTVIESRGGEPEFSRGIKTFDNAVVDGVSVKYAYNVANFTASSGSWTVALANQILLRYSLIGRTLTLYYEIAATTVSATPAYLAITLPTGMSAAAEVYAGMHEYRDHGGAWAIGTAYASGTQLRLYKLGRIHWSTSAATSVHGVATIPVN